MKYIVLVFLLQFSFIGTSQQPLTQYIEVCFQQQKFKGKKSLNSFLKRHKKKEVYKNAPCQFQLICAFHLNESGYVDSISSLKRVWYTTSGTIPFLSEIEDEVMSQYKSFRFYNQVVYKNDTTNMDSFYMILDYECGKGWTINKFPEEYKRFTSLDKDIFLIYRKE